MFDLPVTESSDLRAYTQFRKALVKNGFIMMQESVYCKLALNFQSAVLIKQYIYKVKPPKGTVQLLIITEKQYSEIEYVVGNRFSDQTDTMERLLLF